MAGGGLSCGEADDDRLSAKVPEGPVFETTGSTLDSGGHDCAIDGSNVSARSPTNFGFAARQPPGSRVRMWRSLQTRRHRGASERRRPLSHKWYRVVEGEPDRRHLHRALYLCWRRKLQGVCQIRTAMGKRVCMGGSRLALRGSRAECSGWRLADIRR
jgi:hypothetical protein